MPIQLQLCTLMLHSFEFALWYLIVPCCIYHPFGCEFACGTALLKCASGSGMPAENWICNNTIAEKDDARRCVLCLGKYWTQKKVEHTYTFYRGLNCEKWTRGSEVRPNGLKRKTWTELLEINLIPTHITMIWTNIYADYITWCRICIQLMSTNNVTESEQNFCIEFVMYQSLLFNPPVATVLYGEELSTPS